MHNVYALNACLTFGEKRLRSKLCGKERKKFTLTFQQQKNVLEALGNYAKKSTLYFYVGT